VPDPVRIPINPQWDASRTYDSVEGSPSDDLVFVGRKDLLDPLIAAVAQPDKRGTYLVSGYRGTGKTALLIEALRRAGATLGGLATGWKLLPLVLNVSEVAASLEVSAREPAAPLKIDPQGLLTALLRTLENRRPAIEALPPDLKELIQRTYRKSIASEYTEGVGTRREDTRAAGWESAIGLSSPDAYRFVAAVSGLLVAGLQGLAWLGSGVRALHVVSTALAGVAVLSFSRSRTLGRKLTETTSREVTFKFDKSLHQLETDLKDILAGLHQAGQRVVVVLEELDKIEDPEGKQLDAVIRYFKNLFTQAPALFFFATDKRYYDLISSKIKQARRQRTYAVEHTFFTHRVFVGHPTTQECLAYLEAVVRDDRAKEVVRRLALAPARSLPLAEDGDRTAPFFQVLLFRAANHLFDLKNELRRYVRAAGEGSRHGPTTEICFDESSFPEDEAALAKFQDLVEQKMTAFAFGGGRTYANEMLHDCLYSFFNELGSARMQDITEYFPYPQAGRGAAVPTEAAASHTPAGPASPPPDEQLDTGEVARIEQAVRSMFEDLQRGGAFETDKTDAATGRFVWRSGAARSFRFVRRLDKHEEGFVAGLKQLKTLASPLATGGVLSGVAGSATVADAFVARLDARVKQLEEGSESLPLEKAQAETQALQSELNAMTAGAYESHLASVRATYGMAFMLIGTSSQGGGLHLLMGASPDPRITEMPGEGAVLVAQGEGERLEDDVREFIMAAKSLGRLGIVHVLNAPAGVPALRAKEKAWQEVVPRLKSIYGPGRLDMVVHVLPLDEGLDLAKVSERWGRRLGLDLTYLGSWALEPGANISPVPILASMDRWSVKLPKEASAAPPSQSLAGALRLWLESSERLCLISSGLNAAVPPPFPRGPASWALAQNGAPDVIGIPTGMSWPGPDVESRIAGSLRYAVAPSAGDMPFQPFVSELVQQRRLIPILDSEAPTVPDELVQFRAVLGEAGRGIVLGASLPNELADLPAAEIAMEPAARDALMKQLASLPPQANVAS